MRARKSLPSDAKVLEFPFSSRPSENISDGGYVRIYRRLFTEGDSVVGRDRRLIGAWIEMFTTAAYQRTKVQFGERWFNLERGQLIVSLHEIARNWGVPWETFRRYCKRMEASGRARFETVKMSQGWAKGGPTATLITICNYDIYQTPIVHDGPTESQGRTIPYKESKTGKAKKDSESSLRSDSCPAGAGRAVALKHQAGDQLWLQLWQLQRLPGQKRGKGAAEKAWRKVCRTEQPEQIIEAFAKHQACWERFGWEVGFIPHLATWLNQCRWQDDLPRPRSEGNGHDQRYRRPSAIQEFWRRHCEPGGADRDGFGPAITADYQTIRG